MNARMLAVIAALAGCADVDDRELEDDFVAVETALSTCPRPCVLGRAPKGFSEVRDKRAALDPGLIDAYFAVETTELAKTPKDEAYGQFFAGWAGPGAIYHVPGEGTFAVYGSFLELWAQHGFEQGALRFPSSDAYEVGEGLRQDFASERRFSQQRGGCVSGVRRYLLWDRTSGATQLREECM